MDAFFAKLKNFWYYYKIPVGIGIAVLLVTVYLTAQSAGVPEADYHVGLISITPRSEEALEALTHRIEAAGTDLNGDGQVLVQLHNYPVDLSDDTETTDPAYFEKVAALDADLVGNVSGLFLMETPEVLQYATGGLLDESYLPYEDGLYLCIRGDAADIYRDLLNALN